MADLISAEEAQKILANVDDCGSCDRQSIVTRLAETVVGLHAEVKRLSAANIDLLAEAMRLTDRVTDTTLDLHGEREKVAVIIAERDA